MIKNKSVLVVVLCLLFSFSASYCVQESWSQQFSNWISAKFRQYFGAKPKIAAEMFNEYKYPALGFSVGGILVDNPMAVGAGTFGLMFVTAIGAIDDILRETEKKEKQRSKQKSEREEQEREEREREEQERKKREEEVSKVASTIRKLMRNKDLFPTRSSQINLLVKKDEFFNYIDDKDGIVDQATKQLIAKHFNKDNRTTEQKQKEEKIDTYVSSLKGRLFGLPLKDQIDLLKNQTPKRSTIAEIDGYSSLLGRLENKLAVEDRLSPEQKRKTEGLFFVAEEGEQEKIKKNYRDFRNRYALPQIKNTGDSDVSSR